MMSRGENQSLSRGLADGFFGIKMRRLRAALMVGTADVIAVLPIYLFLYIWIPTLQNRTADVSTFFLMGVFVLFIGRRAWRRWPESASTAWYGYGLVIHFLSVFLYVHISWLRPYLWTITGSGLVTMAVLLWARNDELLKSLLIDKEWSRGIPRAVLRFNRLMTVGLTAFLFILFAVLGYFFGGYQQHAMNRGSTGSSGIGRMSLPPPHLRRFGHPPTMKQHQGVPPSPLSHLFIELFVGGILLVLVATLCWVIWARILPAIWRWLQARSKLNETLQGFVDKQETIERTSALNLGIHLGRYGIAAKANSPVEQVRQAYRKMVRRMRRMGDDWRETDTADKVIRDYLGESREEGPLAERLGQVYDKARYGDGDVSFEDAQVWQETLEARKQ